MFLSPIANVSPRKRRYREAGGDCLGVLGRVPMSSPPLTNPQDFLYVSVGFHQPLPVYL